tara:strand:+ start:575 stop:2218 length:1644 start_codon:yes stop_codon:yes gene_type:complete
VAKLKSTFASTLSNRRWGGFTPQEYYFRNSIRLELDMCNKKTNLKPETQRKIDALCSLREDDFTKDILLPLFQAMNYSRVEFNGGPNERGRDLIAQKANPPLPSPKTVYVQTKKIKSSHKAAGGVEFDKLVFQVRQCLKQPVTDIHGREYQADEVFIICPNQVSARFIDEIKHSFFSDDNKNIHLIDGVSVLSLIDQYKPELMDVLINIEDKIVSKSGFAPGNSELLQAIKQSGKKSIEKLYNDLSFFVGSIDSNLLMHFDIKLSSTVIEIEEDRWEDVRYSLNYVSQNYDISLNKYPLSEIESEFQSRLDEFNSDRNQSLILEKEKLQIRIGDLRSRSEALSSDLLARLQALRASNKIADDEEEIIKNTIRDISDVDLRNLSDFHGDLVRDINSLRKISDDIEKHDSSLAKIIPNIKKRPKYLVEANYEGVKNKLGFKVDRYFSSIEKINRGNISKIDLKKFLVETEKTLTLIDDLVSSRISRQFFEFSFSRDKQDRVAVSAHDIFETGHDIAVYGSAGVGKTTTLEMYSKVCEKAGKNIVYARAQ